MSFPEGTYVIVSVLPQHKVIDLEGSQPLGRVIFFHPTGGKNQQWKVTKVTNTEYSIQGVATGTYITAPGGSDWQIRATKLAPECNNASRWNFVRVGNSDVWEIQSVARPGYVLNVDHAREVDGTSIILYQDVKTTNEKWTFQKVN